MTATLPTDRADPQVGGVPVAVRALRWRPYGRREPVLDGLDLDIPAGQRVLLVGPSGSGKSTLLRALAGVLETADAGERSGEILVGGSDTPTPGSVGLVLQDPGAGVVAATVARDVAFGLENRQVPREQMPPVVDAALRQVGLGHLADAPTSTLSGGESQRLALAGALALQPGVLLLDEPLAMLDADTAAQVVDVVVQAAAGLTLVVVEHRLGPWLAHVDRLLVMDHAGALVADGTPADVLAGERRRLLDLGIWVPGEPDPTPVAVPEDAVAGHAGRLVAHDIAVDRVARPANKPARVVRAVEGVDLDVAGGSALALVGASGSGKSTLLLALAGLLPVTDGEVVLGEGLHPDALPGDGPQQQVPRVVAWVPQSPAAGLVERTVLAEVMAGPLACSQADAEPRARALLDAVGMAHLADQDVTALSGGEQRRLAVVAAVAAGPGVLLTDEMTIGQDRHTWAAVVGLAEAVQHSGGAVVHATHDAALVARCTDRLTLPVRPLPTPGPSRRSLAASAGPLALALACALAIVASLAVTGWRAGLAGLGVEALLGAIALSAPGDRRLPGPSGRLRALTWRLGPMLVAAAGLAWSTWLLGGHDIGTAATAALRLLVAVVPSALLLPLVDPDTLGDHLAQRVHLPARPVVAVGAALQRLQDIGDLRDTIERARRMRGRPTTWRAVPSMLLVALVEVLGSASRLALAMDARGFATAQRRTWARPAPWRLADSVVTLLGLVPWVVVLLTR